MLSEKTLRHPVLMMMVFLMLLVIGLFTISNISIALFPEIDMPYLTISTSYTNADPESVENTVTKPIENALVSLSHLESISSTSSEGRSSVSLEFAYGTDLDQAANDVREKLDRVTRSLPDNVTPTIMKMNMSSDSIMRIALRGNRSADDLKRYAENVVTDILEQADGVGEASAMGGRTKIVRVELELNRLQAYGMTLSQVSSSLAKQNVDLGGGSITEGILDYSIRTAGLYSSIEEINNTVVTTKNGYDIKLSDLGRAYMGYDDASNEVYINGQPGVYISVSKQSGANTVTVADAVYKKIEEVENILPSDIKLEIISDSSESIRDTLSTLFDAAWQGLILAVIILYLFLCSMKSTIIIAISIPLSIVITVLCMNFAGITLNLVTLTGLILGVGMIVDASIVMIDNIYSYRSRGAKPRVAAVLGSSEMLMSVFSGNLTTICVFVPFLFFLKDLGMMGQLFKGIIFTVVIALVSSLFVAIFLVPVLAGYFLPLTNRNEKPLRNPFFKVFYGILNKVQDIIRDYFYRPVLKAALNHRLITILICATALIVSLLMIPTMRISMMTGGSDSSVTLRITLPLGTTLSETSRVVNEFQEIIKEEVKGYKTLIVTTGSGGRSGGSHSGSIEIVLPESSEQIDNSQTIQGKLRPHFADFPSVTFSFGRGMRQQMAGDDLDIVLRSASLSDAMAVAEQIADVMNSIEDISEPSIDTDDGLPQIEIVINRTRAYNFGVSVSAVASEIQACIEGKTVTTYTQGGDDYSVKVMLRDEDVKSVPDLEQIFVQGSKGLVAVSNVATVTRGYGPVTIRRENRTRIIHVTAGILTQTNANVVEDMLKEKIADTFVIPDSVSVSYEGSWKTMNEQKNVYGKIILLAVLLVFAVMAATYESFKAPLINITTIPFLIIGVVAIYKITGQTASMLSAIGIIMLVGIVVNNGIILVDYTNLLIDRGYKMKEACLEAGTSRLRPVLMTTLTTILGMLPMCFATSGSAGMVQPIGVAVVGGLTSSTFITLFFIPVLYSLIMREKKQKKSRIQVAVPVAGEADTAGASPAPDRMMAAPAPGGDVVPAGASPAPDMMMAVPAPGGDVVPAGASLVPAASGGVSESAGGGSPAPDVDVAASHPDVADGGTDATGDVPVFAGSDSDGLDQGGSEPAGSAAVPAVDNDIDFEDGIDGLDDMDGFDLADDDGLGAQNLWAAISVEEIEKTTGPLGDAKEMRDVDFNEPDYPDSDTVRSGTAGADGVVQANSADRSATAGQSANEDGKSAATGQLANEDGKSAATGQLANEDGKSAATGQPETPAAVAGNDWADDDEDDIERAIDEAFDAMDDDVDAGDGWSDFLDDEDDESEENVPPAVEQPIAGEVPPVLEEPAAEEGAPVAEEMTAPEPVEQSVPEEEPAQEPVEQSVPEEESPVPEEPAAEEEQPASGEMTAPEPVEQSAPEEEPLVLEEPAPEPVEQASSEEAAATEEPAATTDDSLAAEPVAAPVPSETEHVTEELSAPEPDAMVQPYFEDVPDFEEELEPEPPAAEQSATAGQSANEVGNSAATGQPETPAAVAGNDWADDEDDIERAIDGAFDAMDDDVDAGDGWSDFLDDESEEKVPSAVEQPVHGEVQPVPEEPAAEEGAPVAEEMSAPEPVEQSVPDKEAPVPEAPAPEPVEQSAPEEEPLVLEEPVPEPVEQASSEEAAATEEPAATAVPVATTDDSLAAEPVAAPVPSETEHVTEELSAPEPDAMVQPYFEDVPDFEEELEPEPPAAEQSATAGQSANEVGNSAATGQPEPSVTVAGNERADDEDDIELAIDGAFDAMDDDVDAGDGWSDFLDDESEEKVPSAVEQPVPEEPVAGEKQPASGEMTAPEPVEQSAPEEEPPVLEEPAATAVPAATTDEPEVAPALSFPISEPEPEPEIADMDEDIWPDVPGKAGGTPAEGAENSEGSQEDDIWAKPSVLVESALAAPEPATAATTKAPVLSVSEPLSRVAASEPATAATTKAPVSEVPTKPMDVPKVSSVTVARPEPEPVEPFPSDEGLQGPANDDVQPASAESVVRPKASPAVAPAATAVPEATTAPAVITAPAATAASAPIRKVMPKKDNAVSNDHHIANFKRMNRIASRPSVANDKKVSAGSFVAYKPLSDR